MPYANPPTAKANVMMDALVELLEADDDLIEVFGFDEGRTILRDDPGGRINEADTRQIVITQLAERDTDASFDDPSDNDRGSDEYRVTFAAVVYVYKPASSKGEAEKVLCVNLTGLLRDVIRKYMVGPNFKWFDIVHRGTEYDSTSYVRRSDSIFVMRARYRKN